MTTTFAWPTSKEAEVRTLANYRRPRPELQARGSLIAADAQYRCYSLKDGLVRAMHHGTDESILLRELQGTQDVADIRMCPGQSIVAAITKGGAFCAWKLISDDLASGGKLR
jgi:hypothetical protein